MPDESAQRLDLGAILSEVQQALAPTLGSELEIDLHLPVLDKPASQPAEREQPAVIVRLGYGAAPNAHDAWLWLDAALATNLVDRALGGRGQLGIATGSSLPSDAECGVLAYLAARAARGLAGTWIQDVSAARQSAPPAHVIWPLSLRWNGGSGIARLGLPTSTSAAALTVQIGWFDTLGREDLDALAVGDVLISDGIALSATTQGLAGSCLLRVKDVADTLRVVLDGAQVHGRPGEPMKPGRDALFVVLHELSLSISDVARLSCEGCLVVPSHAPFQVQLRHGATRIADAELVQVSNVVGMRIQALNDRRAAI